MLLSTLLAAPLLLQGGAGFAALAEEVRERTLPNGLRVLVLPHGEAPVVSFHMHVQVGAIDEASGLTGLAHFAEHMAFKGSRWIGATDWAQEQRLLAACDEAWRRWEEAEAAGAPEEELAALRAAFEEARAAADAACDAGAFDRAMEAAGGLNSNASTGADSTDYYVSLPVERTETWFWLARQMLGSPVMREFYKERDVVMEERRMRTDASPVGAALEALLNNAFIAHPYRDSTIGHMDDLEHLDRPEMVAFWKRHYTADRMILAVVGRVEAEEVFALAEEYLGDLPAGELPRPRRTAEPRPRGPREVAVVRPTNPMALAGWPIPALRQRRGLLFDALGEILAGGPSARLHERLVKQAGAAVEVQWMAGFPGRLDPSLFLLLLVPAPGRELDECLALAQEEIDRLAAEGPTEAELAGVRRRTQMALLQGLAGNAGLARALAQTEGTDGDWRQLFRTLEVLAELRPEDVARAAGRLEAGVRTTVRLVPAEMEVEQ
jgi:predicted Zn-dependent peptidase